MLLRIQIRPAEGADPSDRGDGENMSGWTYRQWLVAAGGFLGALILLGVPTVLVPNDLFVREIEPTWWSYPVWGVTAVLCGLLAATYVRNGNPPAKTDEARSIGGVVLTWFAIGCPVCNKIVLLALGTSGALSWFAPMQPLLAVAGVVLMAFALRARLKRARACPVPTGST